MERELPGVELSEFVAIFRKSPDGSRRSANKVHAIRGELKFTPFGDALDALRETNAELICLRQGVSGFSMIALVKSHFFCVFRTA